MKVTTATPKELIAMMEKNQLDLIYFLDRPRYNNNWNKELEVREPIVYRVRDLPRVPPRLQKGLKAGGDSGRTIFSDGEERELPPGAGPVPGVQRPGHHPVLEASNTEFIIQMIRRSRGVSFLPYFAVQESVRAGQLAVLDVTDFGVAMYRQIFYHKNKWMTRGR